MNWALFRTEHRLAARRRATPGRCRPGATSTFTQKELIRMIIGIVLAALAIVAVTATAVVTARDGYRQVPVRAH